MVEGRGFEPLKLETADLQSAPVGRLGIPPTSKGGIFIEMRLKVNKNITVFIHLNLSSKYQVRVNQTGLRIVSVFYSIATLIIIFFPMIGM